MAYNFSYTADRTGLRVGQSVQYVVTFDRGTYPTSWEGVVESILSRGAITVGHQYTPTGTTITYNYTNTAKGVFDDTVTLVDDYNIFRSESNSHQTPSCVLRVHNGRHFM